MGTHCNLVGLQYTAAQNLLAFQPTVVAAPSTCPAAVVTVVVAILVLLVSLYLVVNYQHPEDRNQAWIPKIVVLLGFAVAFWTILLFPLDVANQQACALDVPLSSCETTLPMTQLWYAVYIAAMAITFVAVPFSIFYYEADSDWWVGRRRQVRRPCCGSWLLPLWHVGMYSTQLAACRMP